MADCTFWVVERNGGQEGEGQSLTASHSLLKGVRGEKVPQSLNVDAYISLRVWLCAWEREERGGDIESMCRGESECEKERERE